MTSSQTGQEHWVEQTGDGVPDCVNVGEAEPDNSSEPETETRPEGETVHVRLTNSRDSHSRKRRGRVRLGNTRTAKRITLQRRCHGRNARALLRPTRHHLNFLFSHCNPDEQSAEATAYSKHAIVGLE